VSSDESVVHRPKYPGVEVELTGYDGNAFAILGRMQKALRDNRVPALKIMQFMDEAASGDYNHLLRTCMEWVEVS
jgi:hypothetical protein